MAIKIAIIGHPNTGKSYSRNFLKKGEESFIISPSSKSSHMKTSGGKPVDLLDISVGEVKGFDNVIKKLGVSNRHEVINSVINSGLPDSVKIETSGNITIVPDIRNITNYMRFIDRYMPHIKNIFIGDFTHYITNVIAGPEFRNRKRGDEAFARYIDLAADSLNNVLLSADELKRKELIVVTEYHAVYDGNENIYRIFVPAGNMLSDKFKPESYYDYVIHTHVVNYDEEQDDTKRFKFVITKKDRYDGRMANLFSDIQVDGMIPNDIQQVIDRVRKNEGIE